MHFVSGLSLHQELQRVGGFDADYQVRLRAKRRRSKGWCEIKEAQYESFWGQKLQPKPATEAETEAWRDLDEKMVAAALEVLPPPRPKRQRPSVAGVGDGGAAVHSGDSAVSGGATPSLAAPSSDRSASRHSASRSKSRAGAFPRVGHRVVHVVSGRLGLVLKKGNGYVHVKIDGDVLRLRSAALAPASKAA